MTTFVLDPGGADELTIDESEIISYNAIKTHTGMGTLRAQLATTKDLLPFAQRKDRLNVVIDGSTEWTGLLVKPGKTQSDAITSIKAFGIAKKLEESRPDYATEPNNEITISQTALDKAIRNYWPRTPFSATITDQQTETVKSGATIQTAGSQSEWEAITSFADSEPVVVDNGKLKRARSAYFAEAEDNNPRQVVSDSSYSDGEASADLNSVGDELIRWTFTTEYDFPANGWEAAVRTDKLSDNGIGNPYSIFVDGQEVGNSNAPELLTWQRNTADFDLPAGTHTLTVVIQQIFDDQAVVDCAAVVDNSFSYTFDNSVDADGHLSGPEPHPAPVTVDIDETTTSLNIDSLTADVSINDTSNGQAIAVSNDGSNFKSESNTSSTTAAFNDPGRRAQGRVTLDGFGSRTTASPTDRHRAQAIDSLTLAGDLNDRVVIDELTLTGNHFENLQQLHDYGNFQFTIEHSDGDISNLTVISYQEGDETRPTPTAYSDPIDKQSSVDATNYYNALFLRGKQRDDSSYPTAEVEDSDEIADVGDRIDTALTDPSVVTAAGAQFRAQALLSGLIDENARRGEITIPLRASITHPGYARSIDFGDGSQLKTTEEVRLREGGDGVEQTHVYTPPDNVADEIEQLRRETRRQRG
ncbi:hypothetical protein OSG_eHP32_00115 [environmental Halophage eHP-32]|nr:hypothetical protein OSG_eHP32_00115 [environmental Halophage eHP-32]